MSEFTAGNVIPKDHLEEVQRQFPEAKVSSLNDKYDLFLTEESLTEKVPSAYLELSAQLPILHFYNAEDHGWGYRLLDQGEVAASFDYSYWIDDNLFRELAEQRYPDEEPYELPQDIQNAIYAEIPHLEAYKKNYSEQFDNPGLQRFAVLGIDPQVLEPIFAAALAEEYKDLFEFVERFKEALGIEKMEWVNYDYEDED